MSNIWIVLKFSLGCFRHHSFIFLAYIHLFTTLLHIFVDPESSACLIFPSHFTTKTIKSIASRGLSGTRWSGPACENTYPAGSSLICITTVIHLDQTEKCSFALDSYALFHSVNCLFLLPLPFFQSPTVVWSHFSSFLIYYPSIFSCHCYFPLLPSIFTPNFSFLQSLFNCSLSSCSYSPYSRRSWMVVRHRWC